MSDISGIVSEKKRVRTEVLAKRDAMSKAERETKSAAICRALAEAFDAHAIALGRPPVVAVYAPIRSEVDVTAFARHAYSSGANVLFPCMNKPIEGETESMCMRRVAREHFDNKTAPFIAKPIKSFARADENLEAFPIVSPAGVDMVAVPMVAFDESLMRLGYGGGNYDAFLEALRDEALVVGVAFEEQRVEDVPAEPHDRRLPRIERA